MNNLDDLYRRMARSNSPVTTRVAELLNDGKPRSHMEIAKHAFPEMISERGLKSARHRTIKIVSRLRGMGLNITRIEKEGTRVDKDGTVRWVK